MLISRLLPLAGALLLAGCASMAPSYERPAAPLPAQYGAGLAATGADAAALDWRGYFTDPALQRLIEQALAGLQRPRLGDNRLTALGAEGQQMQWTAAEI